MLNECQVFLDNVTESVAYGMALQLRGAKLMVIKKTILSCNLHRNRFII